MLEVKFSVSWSCVKEEVWRVSSFIIVLNWNLPKCQSAVEQKIVEYSYNGILLNSEKEGEAAAAFFF